MSEVTLRFVGSGDAFGSGGRLQTCLHLDGEAGSVLIDCGTSSLIGMKRIGIDPSSVGAILLSHLHVDHFGGVPFMVLDGQFNRRTRPLVVAGPPGVRERVETAMELFFAGSTTIARRFTTDFIELRERVAAQVPPVTATAFPVEHQSGAPSYALRVEYGDKVIAYSGDTAWTDTLLDVARGADLFVCEAYYFEKPIKYHLDYRTLRANLSRLDCRRIVLTHMSRDMLDHLGEVELEGACDGKVVRV